MSRTTMAPRIGGTDGSQNLPEFARFNKKSIGNMLFDVSSMKLCVRMVSQHFQDHHDTMYVTCLALQVGRRGGREISGTEKMKCKMRCHRHAGSVRFSFFIFKQLNISVLKKISGQSDFSSWRLAPQKYSPKLKISKSYNSPYKSFC